MVGNVIVATKRLKLLYYRFPPSLSIITIKPKCTLWDAKQISFTAKP